MEHEDRWKHLDEHLLARLAGIRRTELNRLKVRDACEGAFYSVYRIVLLEFRCQSPGHLCESNGEGKTNLDVKLEQAPIFNGGSVLLVRRAHG